MSPLQSDTAVENKILERDEEFSANTDSTVDMLHQQAMELDPESREYNELMVACWNMRALSNPGDQLILAQLESYRAKVYRSRYHKVLKGLVH